MPLREDLLEPIAGEDPSGPDLYYDKVFDQLKEARREDADDIPAGDWTPAQQKKADYRQIIKLAGDALAKRSKDLRLADWLIESQFKIEGLPILVPGIRLIQSLEETFWPTIHPQIEDETDMERRAIAVEGVANKLGTALRSMPLTKTGYGLVSYIESRAVGYEKDATTSSKIEVRKDAIEHGKLTAEDFDQAFAATPKAFYVDTVAALEEAQEAARELDQFHDEKYGNDGPNLARLKSALDEVHGLASSLLHERRKTDPDPVPVVEQPAAEAGGEAAAEAGSGFASGGETAGGGNYSGGSVQVSSLGEAYQLVVRSAELLFSASPTSPVAYLVCAGLRLGETRMQGEEPALGFAVGPTPEMRQTMRALAQKGAWAELLRSSIPILASPCARAWLDLHRYIWRAGQETGAEAISAAVEGTLRSLLAVRPEVRYWTLEDDTGAANHETQQWLDSYVLR